jgi:two-component sensor histidine kinase
MFYLKILLVVFISSFLNASTIKIDDTTNLHSLLSNSQIYIDKTKSLNVEQVQQKSSEFKENKKEVLSYGYSPNFDVWIKFTLENTSNTKIRKIIEYDNALTTKVMFIDTKNNITKKDGLLHFKSNRITLKPIFYIELNPHETNTYYIKASSYITTLIIKLNILNQKEFFDKEIKYQTILALFFGAMLVLAIYNLFIFFFTKDRSYFYYVLYIIGIIAHQLVYTGMSSIYVLDKESTIYVITFASLLVSFPIYALALFTKSFLHTQQYPNFNKVLNIFLVLIPISIVILSTTDIFNKYRNMLALLLFVYLLIITIYAAIKKNKQAYFILFGWAVILIASILMFLSGIGVFNFREHYPYIIEVAFALEAVIFSIALATKINRLQNEKNNVQKKLILQQRNEKEKLKIKVNEKTKELKLLLKELNHRVKNNMQTIVSLIRLQNDQIEDERVQNIFTVIQNRINAMSHLHELLYQQDDVFHVDTYRYIEVLIDEVRGSYGSSVDIILDVKAELKIEDAIYCGLILNELITNSFKYAFSDKKGIISIAFKKEDDLFTLAVSDNGVGFDQNKETDTLGYILVNSLVTDQLSGTINIKSKEGVKVEISWR